MKNKFVSLLGIILGIIIIAFPMIGAGTGGFNETSVLVLIQQTLAEIESTAVVYLVLYRA